MSVRSGVRVTLASESRAARWGATLVALLLWAAAAPAHAMFHLYRIEQIYSNADGSIQFVVLTTNSNGEDQWMGHTLTSTRPGGPTRTFVFPSNLPNSSTAGKRVLIGTSGFAALGIVTPDFTISNGFLATDGGTLNYASADQITYAALPTDGTNALGSGGSPTPNVATNFSGQSGSVSGQSPSPGQLRIPNAVDFGSQTVGVQGSTVTGTVLNIGGTAITISAVTSSTPAEFIVVSTTCNGATLGSAVSCQIRVAFRPAAAGARSGTISVESNGPGSPQTYAVSGTGAGGPPPGNPDLVVSAFSASPTVVNAGQAVNLLATVRNTGDGASAATLLRYYAWNGSAWQEITACRDTVAALSATASENDACAIVAPNVAGTYRYQASVDSVAGESDTQNNTSIEASLQVNAAPPSTFNLAVATTGSGTVTSQPAGIDCGIDCAQSYASGTNVLLVATPEAGWIFSQWMGACGGTLSCNLAMSADRSVGATFGFSGAGSANANLWVQKVYVAYYGRPADPPGLAFWAAKMDTEGGSLTSIIAAFGTSEEFTRRYGGLTDSQLVDTLYQQTLGRAPDPAGKQWYLGELAAGRTTLQVIALDLLGGATGDDVFTVDNRLDTANHYTGKVAGSCPYGGEQTGVQTLAAVTSDIATVFAAKAAIEARCGF